MPLVPSQDLPGFTEIARLRALAQPGDKGLGDVIEREVGAIGGEAFRAWHVATFGVACRCPQPLKVDWNARYPVG